MKQVTVKIAVVDDHRLFRSGLISLIHSLGEGYKIVIEANNGKEFLDQLDDSDLPDIAIVDVSMPVMDGFETAAALQDKYPTICTLILTMAEDETTLIRMLRLGIMGYLSKDVEPSELKVALETIAQKGFHYADFVTGKLVEAIRKPIKDREASSHLKSKERQFLSLACSEYTYKEIADIMNASVKTVDGYRMSLFEQFGVKSRVGLVIYALKNGLIKL